jgi:hypothetical protein
VKKGRGYREVRVSVKKRGGYKVVLCEERRRIHAERFSLKKRGGYRDVLCEERRRIHAERFSVKKRGGYREFSVKKGADTERFPVKKD